MNEEIARVLQMLEEGKVNAEEAERLIRAIKEDAGKPGPGGPTGAAAGSGPTAERARRRPGACRDLADVLRDVARAARRTVQMQRRQQWWRYYQYANSHSAARERRAATMGVRERVRFILTERVMVDDEGLNGTSRLEADLRFDRTGLDVLAWALAEEFGVHISQGALRDVATVDELTGLVEARVSGASPEPAAGAPAPDAAQTPPEPTAAPDAADPAVD